MQCDLNLNEDRGETLAAYCKKTVRKSFLRTAPPMKRQCYGIFASTVNSRWASTNNGPTNCTLSLDPPRVVELVLNVSQYAKQISFSAIICTISACEKN